jgi:chaperonin GroES
MQAIKNKIIVSVGSTVEKSASGIVVDANKKPDRGVVISKGAEVTEEIEAGDTVVFSEYAGKEIKEGSEKYITLNEAEVYYVIKK